MQPPFKLRNWFEPLLVAHTTLLEISCHGSFFLVNVGLWLFSVLIFFRYVCVSEKSSVKELYYHRLDRPVTL